MTDQHWIIIGIVVAVLMLILTIVIVVRNRRERNQYNRSSMCVSLCRDDLRTEQNYQSCPSSFRETDGSGNDADHEEEEPKENDETYQKQLEECRERVVKLIEILGKYWSIKITENFDEDMELNNEGYMFSLVKLAVDRGKIWVIFYPNEGWDVIALIFDQEAPCVVVNKIKGVIDEFFGDNNPDSYPDEEQGCLAYVWGNGNIGDLTDDIAGAAKKNPVWKEMFDHINVEEETDFGDEEGDSEQLKECQVRVYELIMSLKPFYPITVTENFDEDRELRSEGYMFSLIELTVDQGRMWVVFYPNRNYDVTILVFDHEASWISVKKVKGIIDEFFGDDEPESYSGYPAYVWGDLNYKAMRNDLIKAAEENPIWNGLLEQF